MKEKSKLVEQETRALSNYKTALLVGTVRSKEGISASEEALAELERLCETYGLVAVHQIICPIKKIEAATFLGNGKLEEIGHIAAEKDAELILFDDEITPQQQRNLEKLFARPVIDRTELILEVFAQRAQTKEAKLQIELARCRYQLPRLKRLWTHLSRQSAGGGAYLKGEGEKQIEIDRRILRRQIERLKTEIEEVAEKRKVQRALRQRTAIPTFSIVGYTNAGKSTLLNALTGAGVLAEDKLFATLDTTTRKYVLPNKQEILLIDTVGFIRKIPHTLVAAFKSTLEEALYADILLHLIDVSHPQAESQAEATIKVLKELGVEDQPIITVLNKIDHASRSAALKLRVKYPRTVAISALKKEGLDELIEKMTGAISSLCTIVDLRIPQSHYALVSTLMREGRVLLCEYEENDILMKVEIPSKFEHKVSPFLCRL